MITAVRLALVPAPAHVVTALLALGLARRGGRARRRGCGRGCRRCRRPTSSSPTACELVRDHRALAPPFAAAHPVYVLAECGAADDPTEALAEALGDEDAVRDVAVADDTARRAALWTLPRGAQRGAQRGRRPAQARRLRAARRASPARRTRSPAAVAAAGARLYLYGHLGDGNLHVNVLGPEPGRRGGRRRGAADRRRARRVDQRRARHRGREAALARADADARGAARRCGRSRPRWTPPGCSTPARSSEPPHGGSVRDQALAAELHVGLDEGEVRRRDDHVGLLELVLAELVPVRCGRGRSSPRRPRGTCPRRRPRRPRPPALSSSLRRSASSSGRRYWSSVAIRTITPGRPGPAGRRACPPRARRAPGRCPGPARPSSSRGRPRPGCRT